MESLGKQLKEARERRKLTASEAAKGTRLKVQHIESLEREDFSRMAAPAYAKGFIKIYAEYLGLDPDPLIQEYLDKHAPRERPPLMDEETEKKSARNWRMPDIPWKTIWKETVHIMSRIWTRINRIKWPAVPPRLIAFYVVGILFFLAVLIGVTRCARKEKTVEEELPVPSVPADVEDAYPLIKDVPEPYLE